MKFSLAAVVLLASGAVAQLPPGLSLPADIRSYAGSLSDNPAALQALVGIFTASQVQAAVLAAQTLTGAAVAQTFAAAVNQAIAAEPSSLQSIAASEVNRIAPFALTDGLLPGGTGVASSAVAGATSAAGNVSSSAASMLSSSAAAVNGSMASASSRTGSMMTSAASAASSASASASASRSGSASASGAGTAATTTAAGSLGNSVGAVSGISAALLAGGAFVVALL